jgi:hypothetical protein
LCRRPRGTYVRYAVRSSSQAGGPQPLSRRLDKRLDALWKQYRYNNSLKSNKAYCAKLATNEHTWDVALLRIIIPADTAGDVKALIRASSATEAYLRSCSKATSVANWQRAWLGHPASALRRRS